MTKRNVILWIAIFLLIFLAFVIFNGCGTGSGGVGKEHILKTTTTTR